MTGIYPQSKSSSIKENSLLRVQRLTESKSATYLFIYYFSGVIIMVGRSRGNKQVDKNAAKEKSSDSSKHKKKAQRRHKLGGGEARGKSKRQQ